MYPVEDVRIVEVFESFCDLLRDALFIVNRSVCLEEICKLKVIIHDNVDLVLLADAFRPRLINYFLAVYDVWVGKAL